MLNVAKLGVGTAHKYFQEEFAAASSSYLTESGKTVGVWQGRLAAELGLAGAVEEEAYHRLVDGQHPNTGKQLVRHRDTYLTREGKQAAHVPAWDFTLSAPKTWSLAAIVGQDDRLIHAAEIANQKALQAAENYVQARGGGSALPITARKWAVATFRHDTSRPVDGYPAPQLHFHNVAFNLVLENETNPVGKFRSLYSPEVYHVSSLITQTFRDELLRQGRSLGYQMHIDPATGAPEIKGFTQEYLDAESLRSGLIKTELEKRGFSGARAAQIVARQGREDKLNLTPQELRSLHRARGAAFGDQAQKVKVEALERGPVQARRVATPEAAVTFARKRLSERSATFEHHQVLRDALRYGNGTVTVAQIEAEISRRLESGDLLTAPHMRPHAPQRSYRTPEMVQTEVQIIERVVSRSNSVEPIHQNADLRPYAQLADNPQRRQIIRDILGTRDQFVGLNGTAGSAKSTAAGILRELAESQGFRVQGLAPTGIARDSLVEKGLKAETLQMHLIRAKNGAAELHPKTFYVLDESSLASTNQMRRFLDTVRPQDHVLFVGDDDPDPKKVGQHTSIEAGRIFQELQEAGMKTAHFNRLYRQRDPELRAAVLQFRHGNVERGFGLLTAQNRVHEYPSKHDRYQKIAETYTVQPTGTIVISPDNKSRQELNAVIRNQMRSAGHLRGEDRLSNILAARDVGAVDRTLAVAYRPQDALRFNRANKELGITANSYATVLKVDTERNVITIRTDRGRQLTYDPKLASVVSVYEQRVQPFAIGDRVQFTARSKELGVSTRDTATIKALDQHANVTVTLDRSGRNVHWNLKNNRQIDYAYAMTSHSVQGKTVTRDLWNVETLDPRLSKLLNKTATYVGTSRPEYDLQVFTDDVSRLLPTLSRQNEASKALTLEEIQSFRKSVGKEVRIEANEAEERDLTPELSLETA